MKLKIKFQICWWLFQDSYLNSSVAAITAVIWLAEKKLFSLLLPYSLEFSYE